MEFEVEYYKDVAGNKPVEAFLHEMVVTQPVLAGLVYAGISKLKHRENHREPFTKPIGGGLFELRVGRKDTARVIWFYVADRKIILVHAFVKKSNKLPDAERDKALARRRDYERRNPRR